MRPTTRFTWLWIAWVALTLGIEGSALYRSRTAGTGDTLTAHTRRVLGIDPQRGSHLTGRLTFGVAVAWALWHIAVAPAKHRPADLTTRSTS